MTLFALLNKDLRHHWGALTAAMAMWASSWVVALSTTLAMQSDTLLVAGTGLVYYGMPVLALYVVHRLVVLEFTQGTRSFLAALPISAAQYTGVKYTLGLVLCLVAGMGAVLATAATVGAQEIITPRFLLSTVLQAGSVVVGWYGIAFCAAHLGRYRTAFWLLLITFGFAMHTFEPDASKGLLWTSGLGESLDEIRGTIPWSPMFVSVAWGAVASAVGIALGMRQQGVQVARWYTPMTTAERARLVLVVVVGMLAVDVIETLYTSGEPTYTVLPNGSTGETVVRVSSPEFADEAQALGEALDGLRAVVGEDDWPEVVLVPVLADPRAPVLMRAAEHGELVLELDAARSTATLVHEALRVVLHNRTAALPLLEADQAWVVDGAAAWWLHGGHSTVFERRAGYAANTGLTAVDLADTTRLRRTVGRDTAAGVGWAGLATLEALGGRDAVLTLLRATLQSRERHLLGALATSMNALEPVIAEATGLDGPEFRAAWLATLQSHAHTHADALAKVTPQWGTLALSEGAAIDRVLMARWNGTPPTGLDVIWVAADPMHRAPLYPSTDDEHPIDEPSVDIPVPVDQRRVVAATFRLHVEALDGQIWSGLQVFP